MQFSDSRAARGHNWVGLLHREMHRGQAGFWGQPPTFIFIINALPWQPYQTGTQQPMAVTNAQRAVTQNLPKVEVRVEPQGWLCEV